MKIQHPECELLGAAKAFQDTARRLTNPILYPSPAKDISDAVRGLAEGIVGLTTVLSVMTLRLTRELDKEVSMFIDKERVFKRAEVDAARILAEWVKAYVGKGRVPAIEYNSALQRAAETILDALKSVTN